jgi:DNA-binding CsgD family transcriptional regulator
MAGASEELAGGGEWPSALERFGKLLIELYRLAPAAPANEFQSLALDATRAALGFDSAIWAAGAMGPSGPVVHTVYAYQQPPGMMAHWERLKELDTVFLEGVRRPGETIRATAAGPDGCPPFHPDVAAHAHRYGMEHILGTVYASPLLRLMEGLAFYRVDVAKRFTEPERLFKQCLVPHLAEAWRINRLASVHTERRLAISSIGCVAMCDRKGQIYAAGPEFAALVLSEWPEWHGPHLPAGLLDKPLQRYVGSCIVLSANALNDMWLVRARTRSAVDQLSPRELDVARKFAQGMSYQDIARLMHIAPATVRNHLKNIYAKLGLSDKAALANLVRRADQSIG